MKMTYLTDRIRCELTFIARTLHIIVVTSLSCSDEGEYDSVLLIANNALMQPLVGLDAHKLHTLKNRIQRMEDATIRLACHDKAHGEQLVLIAYHFINKLVDDGLLDIPESTPLAKLSDYLLMLINPDNPVTQVRMVKTEKTARKWRDDLRKMGYFIA